MRALLKLVAVASVLLCLTTTAKAQFVAPWNPWVGFGGVYPVPYRTHNSMFINGQLFQITRYGYIYPGSGYTYGLAHVYMPPYGVVTGLYAANLNQLYAPVITGQVYPAYSAYQFMPLYVSPGYYYAAQAAQASQPSTTFFRTPTYTFPTYYVPTY